jgi:hypothetical protein
MLFYFVVLMYTNSCLITINYDRVQIEEEAAMAYLITITIIITIYFMFQVIQIQAIIIRYRTCQ